MRLNILIIIIIFCVNIPIQAQENLSLQNAIKKGLENNYGILISDLNVDIAKNNNSWGDIQESNDALCHHRHDH